MRAFLAIVAILAAAGQAQAGGWRVCNRASHHTLSSNRYWSASQGCYDCHQTRAQSYTHQRYQGDAVENILGGLAKKKTEYQTLLDGLGRLGFSPNGNYQPQGNYTTTGHYSEGYGNLAQQGQTIYASQPHIDVMALGQMSERLASQAQGYGASAVQGAQDLIGQAQRVAEIQASGVAAAAALQAAGNAGGPSFRQYSFQTQATATATAGAGQANPPAGIAQPQPTGDNDLATIVQNKCLNCHSAEKASGGLDFSAFGNLPAEQQASILKESFARVVSSDPDKRMPQGLPELSVEQKAAFAAALVGGQTAP